MGSISKRPCRGSDWACLSWFGLDIGQLVLIQFVFILQLIITLYLKIQGNWICSSIGQWTKGYFIQNKYELLVFARVGYFESLFGFKFCEFCFLFLKNEAFFCLVDVLDNFLLVLMSKIFLVYFVIYFFTVSLCSLDFVNFGLASYFLKEGSYLRHSEACVFTNPRSWFSSLRSPTEQLVAQVLVGEMVVSNDSCFFMKLKTPELLEMTIFWAILVYTSYCWKWSTSAKDISSSSTSTASWTRSL